MTNTDSQPIQPTINVRDHIAQPGAPIIATSAKGKSVDFIAGNGTVFNVQLRPNGSLRVRVRDSALAVLPEVSNSVTIHAVNLDGTSLE